VSKFKIGDKVRVLDYMEADESYGGIYLSQEMEQFKGRDTTIKGIEDCLGEIVYTLNDCYVDGDDFDDYLFSSAMLEKIEPLDSNMNASQSVEYNEEPKTLQSINHLTPEESEFLLKQLEQFRNNRQSMYLSFVTDGYSFEAIKDGIVDFLETDYDAKYIFVEEVQE
jgi:hypothetical protein